MKDAILSAFPWEEALFRDAVPAAAGGDEKRNEEKLDGRQLKLLAAVRVELTVEIGKLSLSLGDLLDLSSGTKLELELPEALPVTLRVDAVPVAAGRIVYEGGEPLVEITSITGEA